MLILISFRPPIAAQLFRNEDIRRSRLGEEGLHLADYSFQGPNNDPRWGRFQNDGSTGLQPVFLAQLGRYGDSPTFPYFRVYDMNHKNDIQRSYF
jgi:hypothetical protein